jgi:hypothetical protein
MTAANVIRMRMRSVGITNAEDAMTLIRDRLYGQDLELLSVRVGVSVSCLYAIRGGRTKWPRHATFFSLIDVLGLELILRSKDS